MNLQQDALLVASVQEEQIYEDYASGKCRLNKRDMATINTTTAAEKLIFGIFAALAEFEREMIRDRTMVGMASARVRGRKG